MKRLHASAVARDSKGAWSYATVWRVADRNNIPLTAGRETMGRHRLSLEQRVAVAEMSRRNPQARQADVASAASSTTARQSRLPA
jgi:hypothetical protein